MGKRKNSRRGGEGGWRKAFSRFETGLDALEAVGLIAGGLIALAGLAYLALSASGVVDG